MKTVEHEDDEFYQGFQLCYVLNVNLAAPEKPEEADAEHEIITSVNPTHHNAGNNEVLLPVLNRHAVQLMQHSRLQLRLLMTTMTTTMLNLVQT